MPSLSAGLLAGMMFGLVVLLALLASVAAVATSGAPGSAPTASPAAADSQRAPADAAATAAVVRASASADARGPGAAMCPARDLASFAAASVEVDDEPAVDGRWRVRVARTPCARGAVAPDRRLPRGAAARAHAPRGPPTSTC